MPAPSGLTVGEQGNKTPDLFLLSPSILLLVFPAGETQGEPDSERTQLFEGKDG